MICRSHGDDTSNSKTLVDGGTGNLKFSSPQKSCHLQRQKKLPLLQATYLFWTKLNRIYSSTMMPRTNVTNVELLNQGQIGELEEDVTMSLKVPCAQDPFVAAGRCFLTLTMMAAWWAMWLSFFVSHDCSGPDLSQSKSWEILTIFCHQVAIPANLNPTAAWKWIEPQTNQLTPHFTIHCGIASVVFHRSLLNTSQRNVFGRRSSPECSWRTRCAEEIHHSLGIWTE